jgi:hypothetical protein
MEFAGQILDQSVAFWMLRSYRVFPATVLPVLPSFLDRLSNRSGEFPVRHRVEVTAVS